MHDPLNDLEDHCMGKGPCCGVYVYFTPMVEEEEEENEEGARVEEEDSAFHSQCRIRIWCQSKPSRVRPGAHSLKERGDFPRWTVAAMHAYWRGYYLGTRLVATCLLPRRLIIRWAIISTIISLQSACTTTRAYNAWDPLCSVFEDDVENATGWDADT